MMDQERNFNRAKLTTPRAAAVAGILFSVLLILSLTLIRISVPNDNDPRDAGAWLAGSWNNVRLALNLLPFSGVAFLWFIGVVRDRIGCIDWISLVFPSWTLLLSVYILIENYRRRPAPVVA